MISPIVDLPGLQFGEFYEFGYLSQISHTNHFKNTQRAGTNRILNAEITNRTVSYPECFSFPFDECIFGIKCHLDPSRGVIAA